MLRGSMRDYGYERCKCPRCGRVTVTDTGVLECDCYPEPEVERCEDCGTEIDEGRYGCGRDYTAEGLLCEDCGTKEGTCHVTINRTTWHTARRDHKDGTVKAGDYYKVNVTGGYYTGHESWRITTKTVLKRAGE